MSKFAAYNIPLKDLKTSSTVEYNLDDDFFKKIDSPEVKKGLVKAHINVEKKATAFELQFKLDGYVNVPCDRCLDDMEQAIHHQDKLMVKFGERFSEENEIVIVPETEGAINVAWFLYEFIILSIPIKHVHAPGSCNKTMASKLKKHMVRQSEDSEESIDLDEDLTESEESIDPRWEGLQNILDNN